MKSERKTDNMLLEFSCSNHRSIKDKITFSAIAGKDDTNEKLLYHFGKLKVLRKAVVYGANGSGKSNLIDAVSFMQFLVINSVNFQVGDPIVQRPHKLLGISNDSIYSIQFVRHGVRYAYGFTLNNTVVSDEYLYYFPKDRQVKIFERKGNDYTAGDRYKGKFDSCKDVLKPNRLFLSCSANFSAVSEVEEAFSFFKNDIIIYNGLLQGNWLNYSLTKINEDSSIKKMVLTFLECFDTDIKDVKIDIEKESIDPNKLPPILSEDFINEIMKQTVDKIKASVVYEKFEIDLKDESTGIKKLFEFLCPLIDIILHEKVLFCDEIDTGFHESILYKIIELFDKLQTNNCAQMFFTTHDTSILSLQLFRRDQIWFTEMKKNERSTDLYSLSEIKNVRKDESVVKGYISGRYGAIPMLNENLASKIGQLQHGGDCNGQ